MTELSPDGIYTRFIIRAFDVICHQLSRIKSHFKAASATVRLLIGSEDWKLSIFFFKSHFADLFFLNCFVFSFCTGSYFVVKLILHSLWFFIDFHKIWHNLYSPLIWRPRTQSRREIRKAHCWNQQYSMQYKQPWPDGIRPRPAPLLLHVDLLWRGRG